MDTNTFASLITDDDIATLRLRRPPLNFLNLEMLRQIQSQLDKAGESPPFRALVIDSDLPAFSAGLEMQEQLQDSGFLLIDQ